MKEKGLTKTQVEILRSLGEDGYIRTGRGWGPGSRCYARMIHPRKMREGKVSYSSFESLLSRGYLQKKEGTKDSFSSSAAYVLSEKGREAQKNLPPPIEENFGVVWGLDFGKTLVPTEIVKETDKVVVLKTGTYIAPEVYLSTIKKSEYPIHRTRKEAALYFMKKYRGQVSGLQVQIADLNKRIDWMRVQSEGGE